jgi:hypothetical protein
MLARVVSLTRDAISVGRGECGMRTGVCFCCGKPGHFAREGTQASANRGQGS